MSSSGVGQRVALAPLGSAEMMDMILHLAVLILHLADDSELC